MDALLDAHTLHAWEAARNKFGGSNYVVCDSGDYNRALIVDGNRAKTKADYVIKVARPTEPLATELLANEIAAVRHLPPVADSLPIVIPTFLGQSEPDEPPWAAFSFVPGRVFSYGELRETLSESEFLGLGHVAGEVILGLSNAVSLGNTSDKISLQAQLDREALFLSEIGHVAVLPSQIQQELSELITTIELLQVDYAVDKDDGALAACIGGHNDINPLNMALTKIRGHWRFTGLFDFGLATTETTPELELRHVVQLGRLVAVEALRAYYGSENKDLIIPGTGDVLAETVAAQWGYIQAIINYIWRLRHGKPIGSIPLKLNKLSTGHTDWSGLYTAAQLMQGEGVSPLLAGSSR